ncbi:hypothetical protein Tco_1228753 [Tanacetum coccineum]
MTSYVYIALLLTCIKTSIAAVVMVVDCGLFALADHGGLSVGTSSLSLNLGGCDQVCKYCDAEFWYAEHLKMYSPNVRTTITITLAHLKDQPVKPGANATALQPTSSYSVASSGGFAAALAVLIIGASQSKTTRYPMRLPMDIRLKIDLGKSVDIVMSDLEDSTVTYTEAPQSPDYVPGEDDVLPAEEQLLPDAVSPITDSPGYITEFDLEEYPEEDDEDPEDDPADYPTNRDDDVEEEEESSGDDADDEDKDEDKEEEEHIALTDFVPPPTCRTTARMSIQDQTPIPFLSATKVDRFLAISTPQPSPLTSYSSPLPQIPSTPLPVSSPLPVSPLSLPASPTYPLGYKAAMIRLRAQSPSTSHILPLPSPIILPHTRAFVVMIRAAAPSTYIFASRLETPPSGTPPLLPIPLPTPSLPLLLPSTFYREGVSEGILAATDVAGLSQRMTYFVTTVRQDTNEIYGRLDDAQDDSVSWVQSMDASDTALFETQMAVLQSLQTPARDPTHPDVPEECPYDGL